MSVPSPESPSSEEIAATYLDRIEAIFINEEFSDEEKMNEIVIIADEWSAEKSEMVDTAQVLDMASKNPEESVEDRQLRIQTYTLDKKCTDALFKKASEDYYIKNGLTEEIWAQLSFANQLVHRTSLKRLHEEYLKEEVRQRVINKLGGNPFSNTSPKDDGPTLEEIKASRQEWLTGQITELRGLIELMDSELRDIEYQKNLPQVSALVLQTNLGRKQDIDAQKSRLVKQLNDYTKRLNEE